MPPAGGVSPHDKTHVTRILAGRYKLVRQVGHGGMGAVYEARHLQTEKTVAVKLLSPQLSKDLKLVARFRREAMAASRLDHENCVRVDDFGEDADGTFYIVMEFIDGHGLADELRKDGPMSAERVARIGVQLARALEAAHHAGVLHRDLKPQNVMLMQRAQRPDIVKVVDFGIAKLTTQSQQEGALTLPGTIFGTPEYMSPEQARGEPLDARSDIYSAGVVLWHMLLGRSPFRGSSVRDTLMRVFSEPAPLPSEERTGADIPPGLERALRRALEKKKEDRYADAASFLDALLPFVTGPLAEPPRRATPGLPQDGSEPPDTLPDGRRDTAPITAAANPSVPESADDRQDSAANAARMTNARATRIHPGFDDVAPAARGAAREGAPSKVANGAESTFNGRATARVLSIEAEQDSAAAREALGPAPRPSADEGTAPRRGRSPSARQKRVVLGVAAAAAMVLLVAAFGVLRLVDGGFLQKPRTVIDVARVEKITNAEHATKGAAQGSASKAVVVDPIARDDGLRRGDDAFANGHLVEARAAYTDAIAADPAAAKALIALATIAQQQKDWAAACDAFDKLIALDARYERQFAPLYARARKLRDAK